MRSITSLKAVAKGRSDLIAVDWKLLVVVPGLNPREDMGDIPGLADQIAARGAVIEPFKVKLAGGQIVVINGHRRIAALNLLKSRGILIQEVFIRPEPRGTTEKDRNIDFLTANSGKPFTLFEEAVVFGRLNSEQGMKAQEIARATGKSLTHVKNCLRLISAPVEVQDLIRKQKVAASLVIDLIRETKGDSAALLEKINEALESATNSGKGKASRKHLAKEPGAPTGDAPAESAPEEESEIPGETSAETTEVPTAQGTTPANPEAETSTAAGEPAQPHESGRGFDGGPNYNPNATGAMGTGTSDRNIERNFNRLNKALDEMNRDHCIKALYDHTEAILDYLEGNRTLGDIKELLLH